MIYYFISFATEDFISPADDDIVLKIAEILKKNKIRGCFHIVGEKARVLRRRGRFDVIQALKEHEIGYHSNFHSIHPVMSEYLENMDWDEGVARVIQEEAPGIADIEDIFNRRPSYFVHTCGKAPQVIRAMSLLGINAVASGINFSIRGKPALFWFCNSFSLNFSPGIGFEPFLSRNSLPPLDIWYKAKIEELNTFVKRRKKGDFIYHIFSHPNKFHSRMNWDQVNFNGKNTPEDRWKIPPQWPEHYSKKVLSYFEKFVEHISGIKEMKCITVSELLNSIQREPALLKINDIIKLAEKTKKNLDYHKICGNYYSPAEIFGLLVQCISRYSKEGKIPHEIMNRRLLGPLSPIKSLSSPYEVGMEDVLEASVSIDREMDLLQHIPASIKISKLTVGPGEFLNCLSRLLIYLKTGQKPKKIKIFPVSNIPKIAYREKVFSAEYGPWVYKKGFKAENIRKIRTLQSWTAKPAVIKL